MVAKKEETAPYAHVFFWMAPNSSSVLGFGYEPKTAYADAVNRHGGPANGYAVAVLMTHFPRGANPAPAVIEGLRASYPPTLREIGEPPDVEVTPPSKKPAKEGAENAAEAEIPSIVKKRSTT